MQRLECPGTLGPDIVDDSRHAKWVLATGELKYQSPECEHGDAANDGREVEWRIAQLSDVRERRLARRRAAQAREFDRRRFREAFESEQRGAGSSGHDRGRPGVEGCGLETLELVVRRTREPEDVGRDWRQSAAIHFGADRGVGHPGRTQLLSFYVRVLALSDAPNSIRGPGHRQCFQTWQWGEGHHQPTGSAARPQGPRFVT